jgi:hypothetical protein
MSALPQKRTWFSTIVMSALCQKQTFCTAAKVSLFNHLVDGREEWRRKSVFQNRNAALSHLMLYVYAASIRCPP